MIQKISLVLLFIGLIVSSLPAYNDSARKDDEVGYALLQRIVTMFHEMAATGTGGRGKVDSALAALMADARQALSDKKIDNVFFYRFNRLLMFIKLTIVEDEQGILKPLIESEIERFVLDKTGEKINMQEGSIGIVAQAVAEGIIDLHLYLKTKPERVKILKDMEQKSEKSPN